MEATFPDLNIQIRKEGRAPVPMGASLSAPAALHPVPLGVHEALHARPAVPGSSASRLRLPAVPRLVLEQYSAITSGPEVLTSALLMRMHRYIERVHRPETQGRSWRLSACSPRTRAGRRTPEARHGEQTGTAQQRVSRGTPAAPADRQAETSESSSASEATLGAGLSLGPQGQSRARRPWRTGAQGTAALLRGLAWSRALNSHNLRESTSSTRSINQCAPNPEGGRRSKQTP